MATSESKMTTRSASKRLCRRCRRINLDAVFRKSHLTNRGNEVGAWVAPVDMDTIESCILCQLMMKTYLRSKMDLATQSPMLRSFSSRRMLVRGWGSIDTHMLSLEPESYSWMPYLVPQAKGEETIRILGSHLDFSLVKSWLQYCAQHHTKTCGAVGDRAGLDAIASFKLIDCKADEIIPACGQQYVALSYVWGKGPVAIPTSTRLPKKVPKTIRDAITATLALGFQYLWIDRYCINQQIKEEVDEQVPKMDLIYNNAQLTIIAAAGKDPEHGLPGVSRRPLRQPSAKIGKHFLVSSMPDPTKLIEVSDWNTRAWTYQEGLLSRRRLVFTDLQVYFECRGMYCREALNFPLSAMHIQDGSRFQAAYCEGVDLGIFPRQLGRTEWEVVERIEAYSKRHLSDPADALKGFSGVLRALGNSPRKLRHCWGVPILGRPPKPKDMGFRRARRAQEIYDAYQWSPTVGFCVGLCWATKKPGERRQGMPSWSWTGWSGSVEWALKEWQWRGTSSRIDMNVRVQLQDGNLIGLDEYCRSYNDLIQPVSVLHLSTWVTPCQVRTGSKHKKRQHTFENYIKIRNTQGRSLRFRFTPTTGYSTIPELGQCLFIKLVESHEGFNMYAMIVSELSDGTYLRIGLCYLHFYTEREEDGTMLRCRELEKSWKEFRLC
ncbi:heterokaryon incompatibility protein-domain-containing protein [Dactylonectria macrodidyma]|uniref:Heterokaryon incompatibility protein-domain-containing protein n=1 Tax=Dactylonectria macrodidyma TaxID=307937 RepID=A0A9P9J3R9_9HYPO|nr:heterokaryon incompatibility protein-domain-containing protein [Dactylonectria macrodidyma]